MEVTIQLNLVSVSCVGETFSVYKMLVLLDQQPLHLPLHLALLQHLLCGGGYKQELHHGPFDCPHQLVNQEWV